MTFLVAAEVEPNKVILAADSRGACEASPGKYVACPDTVEKLFVRARVGIATCGKPYGLLGSRDVPTIIKEDLEAGANFERAIEFLKGAFRTCPEMDACVAGIDAQGNTRIEVVRAGTSQQLIRTPKGPKPVLWASPGPWGCIYLDVANDVDKALDQIRPYFEEASKQASETIGPPYKYLVISPAGVQPGVLT
jgi:hypothetical protein